MPMRGDAKGENGEGKEEQIGTEGEKMDGKGRERREDGRINGRRMKRRRRNEGGTGTGDGGISTPMNITR